MALYPTQSEVDTLTSYPTLHTGQCCDCKVDTGTTRIWLCRVAGGITMEELQKQAERLREVREAQFRCGQQHRRFLEQLFAVEGEMDPVTVVILMHIANRSNSVARSAENTAECLERMVAQR